MAKRTLKRRDVEAVDKRLKKTNSEEAIAYDGEVVHASGNESVSGSKIFANDVYFGDGMLNNIIITESSIKQMRDGSVDTYYLPAHGGTLALQGDVPEHTHSFLTSGNDSLVLSGDGTAKIRTAVNGNRYYEWTAQFVDSVGDFSPPITKNDNPTYGGMFFVVRSLQEDGYDFFTNPLPEIVEGEIEVFYYEPVYLTTTEPPPPDPPNFEKRIVAYRQMQFALQSDSTYSAYNMVGMHTSPITNRAYVFDSGTVPGTGKSWEDTVIYSMMGGNFWMDYAPEEGPIVLNLGPGGTFQTNSSDGLHQRLVDTGSVTVKTVATIDDITNVGDQRYSLSSHTHNSITSGNTTIAAYNGSGETGGRIIKSGQDVGFLIRTFVTDQANQVGIMIEMEIPIKISEYSHSAFRQLQSVRLGIWENEGVYEEIVPMQTVQLDHTKFGGPESQYYGLATNGITQYNQEWFDNHSYNWLNDIYNAPFYITATGGNVESFFQAWGPLGTTTEYPSWEAVTGVVYKQIATVEDCDGKYALSSHNHDERYASAAHYHDSLAKAEETQSSALSSTLSLSGDGTVLVETSATTTTVVFDTTSNGVLDITSEQQAQIDQMEVTQYTGSFVTLRRSSSQDPGPNGGAVYGFNFSENGSSLQTGNDMGTCEMYPDGTIRLFAGLDQLTSIFNASFDNPSIVGHAPSSQQTTVDATTNVLATQSYVDQQIGDINTVLDAINGEVI